MPNSLRGPRSSLLSALHFSRDPAGFAREGVRRYGDPFIAPLPSGTVVVTGSPEGMKEVLTADSAVFEPYAEKFLEPAMGTNSLVLLSGERHKRERKLLMPPFHGERMRAYGEIMQQSALRAMEGRQPGASLVAQHIVNAISIEIISRAVFGVEGPERVRRFIEVLLAYGKAYTPLLAFAKPLRRSFGGFGPWARFQKVARQLDMMLGEQIENRRADKSGQGDVLSLMLAARDEEGRPMSEAEIKDELLTLLLAGYETTAITMAWALYLLHRHPEAKQRLDAELGALGPRPEPEALVKLPYLSAVVDETLRLHPALAVLTRKVRAPFTLLGHELPVGMGLMPSITLVHSHPDIFPEPERFRPERFLERKFSGFEYLPFGGGVRRCLGAAFSLYKVKVVIGTLLSTYRFSLAHDRPIRAVLLNIATGPAEPIPMRYEGPVSAAAAAA